MNPENVQIIRSGPKIDKIKINNGNEFYKKGRKYLVGYVGTVGEQEGIDLLLKSILFITKIRQDVHFAIIGGSTMMEQLINWRDEMGLKNYVDFYGRVTDELMLEILNTAEIGVNPDKPTELNNLSTMNKIMEYMALKKPIVQFDLKEGRYSAQEASLYAIPNDTNDFANKIMYLLDNESIREKMGEFGYTRVLNQLSWEFESKKLVDFYHMIFKNIS
jgi:glycosyltransferase involved in cell wall biosynthesis